jgi:hypothetical protein
MKRIIIAGALGLLWSPVGSAAQDSDFQRVVQIGVESGPEEYTFGAVSDVQLGPAGEIYVLDLLNAQVSVFDRAGQFIRSYGQKGSGPGEFQFPTRLFLSDSGVHVLDPTLAREVLFDRDGSHVRTTSAPPSVAGHDIFLPVRFGQWLVAKTSVTIPGSLVALVRESPDRITREAHAYRQRNPQVVGILRGSQLDTIFSYDHGFIQYFIPNRGVSHLTNYWGPGGSWAVAGDSMVALVDGYAGSIRILRITRDGVAEAKTGGLSITPQPLGPRDWERLERLERTQRELPPRIHLVGPLFKSQVADPVFAADGTLWVRRNDLDPGTESTSIGARFLLVPMDDRPQSVVQLPPGLSLNAVRGNLLAGVRKTDLGVHQVEVWQQRR